MRGEALLFSPGIEDVVQEGTQDSLGPTRPIRLFERPEPVEAIAEVPDGPPARFRWRRVLHEVAIAEGPERIAMEWWRDETGQALTRDYFRVESRDGLRAWLYREGLYGRETPQPRWFLHGLFG
jgi:protein ImuB